MEALLIASDNVAMQLALPVAMTKSYACARTISVFTAAFKCSLGSWPNFSLIALPYDF
jgi:hypothetical protein